ncbi:hypothetical protein KQI42_17840 [Tissierella sp. MSJ-40]|uniref:Uncharacterized protein n=1 Tax=Tissierella simiarum TaxID=2841534 RepID=A0ABS6EAB9_9FIRM|nr:hypothetical protein [Tissierella simiarum]MBU5439877.1 hypothetical protein [Tissierella simiarum]
MRGIIIENIPFPQGATSPYGHQNHSNKACGVHSVDTKGNYVEILRFKQFHDHFEFIEDEHNFKKKVLKKYFNVSVVVNLVCGDTKK